MMLTELGESLLKNQDAQALAHERRTRWAGWLEPVSSQQPTGDDPGFDDGFQRMRMEINKLSGIDTALICQLAERLLINSCKDVRVATYYLWARLHKDGDAGLAEGMALLACMVDRYGENLLPTRVNRRKAALEWMAGGKVLDSLSLYPEVVTADFARAIAALMQLHAGLNQWAPHARPDLSPLITALCERLDRSGGADALVPQHASAQGESTAAVPPPRKVQSGRDLLDQGRELAEYLRSQPQGWLSGARLMRSLRWDTVHQLPPQDAEGNTRLTPPRAELRGQLKRLFLQRDWQQLLEQAERMYAEGVNHFWLDLQWYACQALGKQAHPCDVWAGILRRDMAALLERLPGLARQSYCDGTPFADEVTQAWINRQLSAPEQYRAPEEPSRQAEMDDVLALESEALAQADKAGVDAALGWLAHLPGDYSARQRWLQRLLMARIAEQYGKNEMALHLLTELDNGPIPLTLPVWEPQLSFEVKARLLKLLRHGAARGVGDKAALSRRMEQLLSGLVAIDPARAAVLCG